MSAPKYSSYALTIRPRNGITQEQIRSVCDWISKRSTYYHVVTEKLDHERHIHAGLFLRQPVTRSNMQTNLTRLGQSLGLDSDEMKVLNAGLKIMYSADWIFNYLDKDDSTQVVLDNLPERHHIETYLPPPLEDVPSRVEKKSKFYWKLESLWYLHVNPGTEINTRNARDFLFDVMYNKRLIDILRDDKVIIQVARHLVRFLNKSSESTIELPCFEKEE